MGRSAPSPHTRSGGRVPPRTSVSLRSSDFLPRGGCISEVDADCPQAPSDHADRGMPAPGRRAGRSPARWSGPAWRDHRGEDSVDRRAQVQRRLVWSGVPAGRARSRERLIAVVRIDGAVKGAADDSGESWVGIGHEDRLSPDADRGLGSREPGAGSRGLTAPCAHRSWLPDRQAGEPCSTWNICRRQRARENVRPSGPGWPARPAPRTSSRGRTPTPRGPVARATSPSARAARSPRGTTAYPPRRR
jgi:hypothetical protein